MTHPTMTAERLRQFGAAWARADLDALMGFVTDDCIYLASVGPEPGTTYRGREQVRRRFAAMLAYDRGRERQAWSWSRAIWASPNGHSPKPPLVAAG
jgi:ketosteroid isomerase-like protein